VRIATDLVREKRLTREEALAARRSRGPRPAPAARLRAGDLGRARKEGAS
jgi:hypothetical protein